MQAIEYPFHSCSQGLTVDCFRRLGKECDHLGSVCAIDLSSDNYDFPLRIMTLALLGYSVPLPLFKSFLSSYPGVPGVKFFQMAVDLLLPRIGTTAASRAPTTAISCSIWVSKARTPASAFPSLHLQNGRSMEFSLSYL